jgi:RNA polymerase sigma factor (TIGR02999 family)
MEAPGQITRWLVRLREGDEAALERLMPLLYDELRGMARRHLRHERPGHTLNPTALVNEVYLKLVQQQQIQAEHRTQFLAVASRTMRRILVDYARTKKRLKRGGGQSPVPLNDVEAFLTDSEADEVLALDEALNRLATFNERASQVVQYRFYSGLTLDETAAVLAVSVKTVQRDWLAARAWLRKEVTADLGM